MTLQSHPHIYETIGKTYTTRRQPDPRIAAAIHDALGGAKTVCNIGAGAGSYEPLDREVTAVEPSKTMTAQRTSSIPVICAAAEDLPFDANEFDAAMAILSVHHWEDPRKGLREMQRVSRRQVVFTFDAGKQDLHWLLRDYVLENIEFENKRSLPIKSICEALGKTKIVPVPIPHDCTDGFMAAYWRRPEMYLLEDVQASISSLAQLPRDVVLSAMDRLRADLKSGVWRRRNSELLEQESYDFGYCLIVAEQKTNA